MGEHLDIIRDTWKGDMSADSWEDILLAGLHCRRRRWLTWRSNINLLLLILSFLSPRTSKFYVPRSRKGHPNFRAKHCNPAFRAFLSSRGFSKAVCSLSGNPSRYATHLASKGLCWYTSGFPPKRFHRRESLSFKIDVLNILPLQRCMIKA